MNRRPRMHARGRLPACGAGRWLAMIFSIAAVLAMGVITFPAPTGVVWARVDRAGPPASWTIGRSTTTDEPNATAREIGPTRSGTEASAARRMRMVALPATISVSGSDAQIPVTPASSSAAVGGSADPSVVGRWMTGQGRGAPGRVVITVRGGSPAGSDAIAAFGALAAGDRIQLTGADGRVQRYQVTDRRELATTRLDGYLFTDTGESDLVVVTCVGRFDSTTNSYDSSVMISAREVNG